MFHRYRTLLAACCLLASGCPSTPLLVSARPIGNGKNAVIVGASAYGISLAALGSDSKDDDAYGLLTVPSIDLMYRRGIGDSFDLGLSITGGGKFGIDGKINLINTPVFALSVDPGVGGFFAGVGDAGGGYLQFTVPVLLDIALGQSVRLTLAPSYSAIYAFASADSGNQSASTSSYSHLFGGHVAFEFALGQVFRLQPYAGAQWFYNADLDESTNSTSLEVAHVWFTAGVAFKWVF